MSRNAILHFLCGFPHIEETTQTFNNIDNIGRLTGVVISNGYIIALLGIRKTFAFHHARTLYTPEARKRSLVFRAQKSHTGDRR